MINAALGLILRMGFIGLLLSLSGCSYFVSSFTDDLGRNVTKVILNHEDPETVAQAIPSYLVLLEAMSQENAGRTSLLASTSELYGAYINLIPKDSQRGQLLASKSFDFALRSACSHRSAFCLIEQLKFPEFKIIIDKVDKADVPALYTLASAWAGWVQAHSADWNAVAQLAQVKAIMTKIVELDETYKAGGAHIYLGVMATLIPPAMGGEPEIGRKHFERALVLSQQRNLMIKVIYAKQYARLMFDRELHDRLLQEVLSADPKQLDLTLINRVAQQQAQALLASGNDYF